LKAWGDSGRGISREGEGEDAWKVGKGEERKGAEMSLEMT